jgi:3-oxoacyl-[acyl-carrier-protein] synthase I
MKMKKNNVYVTSYSSISSLGFGNEESLSSLSREIVPIYIPGQEERFKYPYFKIEDRFKKNYDFILNSQIAVKLISFIENDLTAHSSIPIFFSTSTGGIKETENIYEKFKDPAFNYPLFERHFFNKIINDIKDEYKDKFSEAFTFTTACSSSGHSILQAYKFIKNGLIDKALIIGVDCLALTTMIGFDSLKLVSHSGTKPLTMDRNGMSLGEGGGVIFLESNPSSQPEFEICGCASNSDGYHISSPDPEGKSQKECILKAIKESGINPCDIDYINAHGTGTLMNDEIELKVLKSIFSHDFIVTSLKSFIGHTLGASTVLEIVLSFLMLKNKKIFQPSGYSNPMEKFIPSKTINCKADYFLKNSFGFGGNNVSIVIKNSSI